MRLLLDTHAFLWFVSDDERLSTRARRTISDPKNDRWLSLASVWEMAIKLSLGKLRLDVPLDEMLESEALGNAIAILGIERRHIFAVAALPYHHRDPFDRLLVCQARSERLTLVSADRAFDAYGLRRVWDDEAVESSGASDD